MMLSRMREGVEGDAILLHLRVVFRLFFFMGPDAAQGEAGAGGLHGRLRFCRASASRVSSQFRFPGNFLYSSISFLNFSSGKFK